MLRTVVPPPAEPITPVMSMPAFLNSPFSIATAKGAPYRLWPHCVMAISSARAGALNNVAARTAAPNMRAPLN
jgi:hypothetical protein